MKHLRVQFILTSMSITVMLASNFFESIHIRLSPHCKEIMVKGREESVVECIMNCEKKTLVAAMEKL